MSTPVFLHVSGPSHTLVEVALLQGYDGIILDMQHGELDLGSATRLIRAIPGSLERVLVRIPSIDSGLIGCLLDAGAGGVIAPSVETPEQARAVVHAVKFAPVGGRSLGPMRPGLYAGPRMTESANAAVAAYIQIETSRGVAHRDEILDVEGLDGVYIGPADLALSMGEQPRLDWEAGPVKEAVDEVAAASSTRGLRTGMFTVSPTFARTVAASGQFSFLGLGSDQGLFNQSVASTIKAFREDS